MPKFLSHCAAAALAACLSSAGAQTLADQINTMNAQVQLLTKQAELRAALSRNAGFDMGTLPRVIAVYGAGSKLVARLLLPSGMISTYDEGDVIRGSMKVAAISPRSVLVTVSNGNKPVTLALDFVAGTQAASAGGAAQPGSPMPSPFPGAPGSSGAASGGPLPPELLPAPPSVGKPLPPARAEAQVMAPAR
jgi:type IV pilus biogenesis protein PilP